MCPCGKEDKWLECFKFCTLFVVFKWHLGDEGVKMQPFLLLLGAGWWWGRSMCVIALESILLMDVEVLLVG